MAVTVAVWSAGRWPACDAGVSPAFSAFVAVGVTVWRAGVLEGVEKVRFVERRRPRLPVTQAAGLEKRTYLSTTYVVLSKRADIDPPLRLTLKSIKSTPSASPAFRGRGNL